MKYPAFRLFVFLFGWIVRLVFRTTRTGIEKIPKTGPVILAVNHASNLDPILVGSCVPRTVINLGKDELFQNPLAKFILGTLAGQIPVDLNAGFNQGVVDVGLRVLEQGLAFGVYPEGNRTPDGKLQKSSTGIALFAFLSGATVYPIAVAGTFEAWPRHKTLPTLFKKTRVMVGDGIPVPKDPKAVDDVRRCRVLTDDIMTAIGDMLGEPYPRTKLPGVPQKKA